MLISDIALHHDASSWIDSLEASTSNSAPRIAFHRTDVSEWKQLEDAFSVYERQFGGLPDLICPGAGIYEPVRILRTSVSKAKLTNPVVSTVVILG